MPPTPLTISTQTHRRFILGKQGLFPGRRWRGLAGAAQAMREGAVVQIDPLSIVARSHDIALFSRVLDYSPADLDRLLYTERALFDYGGTVMAQRMDELPYFRVVMERKRRQPRWTGFAAEFGPAIAEVLEAVRQRGPLGGRDFKDSVLPRWNYRSGKVSGQALYYLWLAGELMTHSRRGFQRLYDLRERVAPADFQWSAAEVEADDFFAVSTFRSVGMTTPRGWRGAFAANIERPVSPAEAEQRLAAMQASGIITPVLLADDPTTPRFMRTEDLPLLETLHHGSIPAEWTPLESATTAEAVPLAPLEIVSARGRALPLFGFEYVWEVYKPKEKRRWGYYTLPILVGDRLVARLDPELKRAESTLHIHGFWIEDGFTLDESLRLALSAGLARFAAFTGAQRLQWGSAVPGEIQEALG